MQAGNSFAFLCHDINELDHFSQIKLPRVTVVMPLKGFGEHNLHNLRSQVRLMHLFLLKARNVPTYSAFLLFFSRDWIG